MAKIRNEQRASWKRVISSTLHSFRISNVVSVQRGDSGRKTEILSVGIFIKEYINLKHFSQREPKLLPFLLENQAQHQFFFST